MEFRVCDGSYSCSVRIRLIVVLLGRVLVLFLVLVLAIGLVLVVSLVLVLVLVHGVLVVGFGS